MYTVETSRAAELKEKTARKCSPETSPGGEDRKVRKPAWLISHSPAQYDAMTALIHFNTFKYFEQQQDTISAISFKSQYITK